MCLAVNCHLHIWQNDRGLLRATALTRGWNGFGKKSQHVCCTLTFLCLTEKKGTMYNACTSFCHNFSFVCLVRAVQKCTHHYLGICFTNKKDATMHVPAAAKSASSVITGLESSARSKHRNLNPRMSDVLELFEVSADTVGQ